MSLVNLTRGRMTDGDEYWSANKKLLFDGCIIIQVKGAEQYDFAVVNVLKTQPYCESRQTDMLVWARLREKESTIA